MHTMTSCKYDYTHSTDIFIKQIFPNYIEATIGPDNHKESDLLTKVVEPKKQFQADMAMRGPRPGVRPVGRAAAPRLMGPRGVRPTSTNPM